MASLAEINEQLKTNNDQNMAGDELVKSAIETLTNSVNSLLIIMKQSQLDMIEALREMKGSTSAVPDAPEEPKVKKNNWAAIIGGIVAIASGILIGLSDSLKELAKLFRFNVLFNGITSRIGAFTKAITTAFDDDFIKPFKAFLSGDSGFKTFTVGLKTTFMSTFSGAAKIFDDLIQPFRQIFAADGTVGKTLTKIFTTIKAIFKFQFGPLEELGNVVKNIFGGGDGPGIFKRIGTMIKGVFDPIIDTVAKAFDFVKAAFSGFSEGSTLMRTLSGIGRFIGRLFAPIALIMTAVDVVKGAFAGFIDDEGNIISKTLSAIQGGITGLVNSIIGLPLDLLKSVVAWALGKLGFDEASDALKKFSFSDMISNLIDGLFDTVRMIFNGLIEGVARVADKVGLGDKVRGLKFDTNVKERQDLEEDIDEAQKAERIADQNLAFEEKRNRILNTEGSKVYVKREGLFGGRRLATPEERAAMKEESDKRLLEKTEASFAAGTEVEKLKMELADLTPAGTADVSLKVEAPVQNNTTNNSSSQAAVVPMTSSFNQADAYREAYVGR